MFEKFGLVRQKMNQQLTPDTTFEFSKKDKHIRKRESWRDKGKTSQRGHQG